MVKSGPHIVLGVSGSIAAVKSPELVRLLIDRGCRVSCVLTRGAQQFVSSLALATFSGRPVYTELFGPEAYQMPHLSLADEADALVIAPATATVIARCAQGLAEDMVSLVYLTTKAPVLNAPAMHNTMWEHPATQENVKALKSRGATFVGPYIGPLADRRHAEGRMEEPEEIAKAVENLLKT